MMKKLIALLLALFLAPGTMALSEEAASTVVGSFENGSYILRIPVAEDDPGWFADPVDKEEASVKLAGTKMENGCFVAQYDPVHDGETTVTVHHMYTAVSCDQVFTWNLRVQDGKIQEVTGGSHTAVSPDEEVDAVFSGTWLEKDTQYTRMTVAKNPEMGWDVEIVSPLTHGGWKLTATLYQDCREDGFVYDQGKLYSLSPEVEERLEEEDQFGVFHFEGTEEALSLVWTKGEAHETALVFERAE